MQPDLLQEAQPNSSSGHNEGTKTKKVDGRAHTWRGLSDTPAQPVASPSLNKSLQINNDIIMCEARMMQLPRKGGFSSWITGQRGDKGPILIKSNTRHHPQPHPCSARRISHIIKHMPAFGWRQTCVKFTIMLVVVVVVSASGCVLRSASLD